MKTKQINIYANKEIEAMIENFCTLNNISKSQGCLLLIQKGLDNFGTAEDLTKKVDRYGRNFERLAKLIIANLKETGSNKNLTKALLKMQSIEDEKIEKIEKRGAVEAIYNLKNRENEDEQ